MRLFTTSPMLMIPHRTPSRTTGTCRIRRSVITAMSDSTSSSGEQVKTVDVMMERTGSVEQGRELAAQAAHDVALGDDAVDVLAVRGHHQRPHAVRTQRVHRGGHRRRRR